MEAIDKARMEDTAPAADGGYTSSTSVAGPQRPIGPEPPPVSHGDGTEHPGAWLGRSTGPAMPPPTPIDTQTNAPAPVEASSEGGAHECGAVAQSTGTRREPPPYSVAIDNGDEGSVLSEAMANGGEASSDRCAEVAKKGQRGGGGGGGVGIRKKPRGRPPKGKVWNGRTWVELEGMSDTNHHDSSARSGTSKPSKRRSNRTADPKPFVANENDTLKKIAKSLCVEAEELVGLNEEKYPGITLTSKLRQNTTILVPAGLGCSMLEIVEISDEEDRDQGSEGGDTSADGTTTTTAAAARATTRADDEATLATATNGTVAHLAGLEAAKAAAVEVEDYARAADLKRQIDAAKSWPQHDEIAIENGHVVAALNRIQLVRDLIDARRELEQVRKRDQEMNALHGHRAKLQKGLVVSMPHVYFVTRECQRNRESPFQRIPSPQRMSSFLSGGARRTYQRWGSHILHDERGGALVGGIRARRGELARGR
mmetsp:Transcript_22385/g.57408  ORF Transcript_22385/g.57408 Transcript_22385/m.57408 type:complete len:483 (-) Transcript_22385:208-1656(-)